MVMVVVVVLVLVVVVLVVHALRVLWGEWEQNTKERLIMNVKRAFPKINTTYTSFQFITHTHTCDMHPPGPPGTKSTCKCVRVCDDRHIFH